MKKNVIVNQNFNVEEKALVNSYRSGIQVDDEQVEIIQKYIRRLKYSVEPTASCINDFMYIGNAQNAQDIEWLKTQGITHVLNCAATDVDYGGKEFFLRGGLSDCDESPTRVETENSTSAQQGIEIEYCGIPSVDGFYDIIKHHSREAINFITGCREKNGKILIHCRGGVNRSVALACAYFIQIEKKTLHEAVKIIASKRGRVLTNRFFCHQLLHS